MRQKTAEKMGNVLGLMVLVVAIVALSLAFAGQSPY